MSELLRCPFCGSEAEIVTLNMLAEHSPVGVGCSSCAAILGEYSDYKRFNTEAEAIAAWNTRAERTCELSRYGYCSECGTWIKDATYTPNYCPNCGAKVIA